MSRPPTIRSRAVRSPEHARRRAMLLAWMLLVAGLAMAPIAADATGERPEVDRLYCAYFLREPDAGGRAYWYEQRAAGLSLIAIAEFFAQSPEFRDTYGQQVTTGDFVRLIYRNLFDRTPDTGGFEFWKEKLDSGEMQRGSVMAYFSESAEFRERVRTIGCGNTGGGTIPIDAGVEGMLAAMTGWDTPTKLSSDRRTITNQSSDPFTGTIDGGAARVRRVCGAAALPLISRTFTELPAFAFAGQTLPGLIVEGSGIPEGDLRIVPLERSDIKLVSDAASENPVRSVASPTTSGIATAVAALKRDADARLTGIDVVASDITFTQSETHSFEQSTLNVGVSLHYESATLDAGFESEFNKNDAVERHSISVRMVQPMFTIAVEQDGFASPGSYFGAGVTQARIQQLLHQGRLGSDNPPVLIESVTYGRIMAFTMTSTTAESSTELMAAVDAAHRGISGSATLTEAQQRLLSTSTTQILSYGGDQSLALAAIKSGDLRQFFGPANTTTAAPLTMSLRTLDKTRIDVADEASLQQIVCEELYTPHEFGVWVKNLWNGQAQVYVNDILVAEDTTEGSGTQIFHRIPANGLRPGKNTIIIRFHHGECAWFGAEQIEGFVARLGSDGRWEPYGWSDSFHGTACFFDWTIEVNTTTGTIVEV